MTDTLALLPAILAAALVASASPGPATLAITTTAAQHGTRTGLALAAGVLCGSLTWSVAAAAGLSAAMLAHAWIVGAVRVAGGLYLLWLAYGAARRALRPAAAAIRPVPAPRRAFAHGLLLHLTNPKAILFFGALYALILTPGTTPAALALVVVAVGLQSGVVFLGYALLFSRPRVRAAHARAARWIDGAAALLFGAFGLRLLGTRLA